MLNREGDVVATQNHRAEALDRQFLRKLFLILLVGAVGYATWKLSDVLLLALGAALLALVLRGLAGGLCRRTRLSVAWSVAIVVLALMVAFSAVAWLFGTQMATQFDQLARDLPKGLSRVQGELAASTWGIWLLAFARDIDFTNATSEVAGRLAAFVGTLVSTTAYIAVLLFAAVYLAAQPDRYRDGLLRLMPPIGRERLGAMLDLIGVTLRRWLVAQSFTMAIVGIFTGLGLWAIGIGAPLALGLIAFMFAFIPYVGPVLAAAPGLLMAATQGPIPMLYAIAVYAAVHFVEGNLITPVVQAKAVELPPVLTLFATLAFGVLFGPVGVLLAAPLTVVLLVAVNILYLEDVLGEQRVWPQPQETDTTH